jgi:hypothetical protein
MYKKKTFSRPAHSALREEIIQGGCSFVVSALAD